MVENRVLFSKLSEKYKHGTNGGLKSRKRKQMTQRREAYSLDRTRCLNRIFRKGDRSK